MRAAGDGLVVACARARRGTGDARRARLDVIDRDPPTRDRFFSDRGMESKCVRALLSSLVSILVSSLVWPGCLRKRERERESRGVRWRAGERDSLSEPSSANALTPSPSAQPHSPPLHASGHTHRTHTTRQSILARCSRKSSERERERDESESLSRLTTNFETDPFRLARPLPDECKKAIPT